MCKFNAEHRDCYGQHRISVTDIRPTGGPLHRTAGLSAAALEFGALSGVAVRANGAYTGQLSLAVGLSFSGTLVDVYLCCFHALSLAAPWTTDMIGGVRALNNLLRLSAVSGAAHYAFKQVCVCVCIFFRTYCPLSLMMLLSTRHLFNIRLTVDHQSSKKY